MATAVIRNLTSRVLTLPAPVGRNLKRNGSLTVTDVDTGSFSTAALQTMVDRGDISVTFTNVALVDGTTPASTDYADTAANDAKDDAAAYADGVASAAQDAAETYADGVAGGVWTENVTAVPNSTVDRFFIVPKTITVSAIKLRVKTQYATAGFFWFGITNHKAAGGTANLVTVATYDIPTLTDGVVTAIDLTATTADLTLAAGDVIHATFISTNADLTGAGLSMSVVY